MKDLIYKTFLSYGYTLTDKQINQFEIYYKFLIEENKKYNLTAITQPLAVVVKHFIDSILPEKEIPQGAKVIDIGTGAGFPGVPLKILRPDINITLVDSLQKRVNFLNMLFEKLELKGEIVHSRAEDFIKNRRETFDIALSRAVAFLPTLSEYLIPYVKINGFVIMYKGEKLQEELELSNKAISTLGAKVEKIEEFYLKEVESKRYILLLKKVKKTDSKYPRGKNLPKTKPII